MLFHVAAIAARRAFSIRRNACRWTGWSCATSAADGDPVGGRRCDSVSAVPVPPSDDATTSGAGGDTERRWLVVLLSQSSASSVAIGTAGVPGGSLPLLAIVLAQVGVEPGMIALILGTDRIVDMTRTMPNVTSDLVCSLWLAKREGATLKA